MDGVDGAGAIEPGAPKWFSRAMMTIGSTSWYILPLMVTLGPALQWPSQRCPVNSTPGGSFREAMKSWITSMFRLFPREKQELPMQIVMLVNLSGGIRRNG